MDHFNIAASTPPGKGIFIAVEGVDGSGKTTAAKYLVRYLDEQLNAHRPEHDQRKFVHGTREPGGTPFAEAARELFIHAGSISAITATTLITAIRRDHWEKVIRPVIAQGGIVVSDRYLLSTLAYQNAAGGDFINGLHAAVIGKENDMPTIPSLTLFLKVDRDVANKRVADRAEKMVDHYEQLPEEEQLKRLDVYERYLKDINSLTIVTIDANVSEELVRAQIRKFVHEWVIPMIELRNMVALA